MTLTAGKLPDRIHAIVELYDPQWVTIDTIQMELGYRFDTTPDLASVRRAIHRLANAGLLRKRVAAFYDYNTGPERVHRSYGAAMGYQIYNRLEVTV